MLNSCQIIGYLGRDPEMRYFNSGQGKASFSVAVSEKWTDKQTGEKREETTWFNCSAWAGTAEIAAQYLSKGSKVFCQGKIRTFEWDDKEGNKRYGWELVVQKLVMLDSKDSSERKMKASAQRSSDKRDSPARRREEPEFGDDIDDDIPF